MRVPKPQQEIIQIFFYWGMNKQILVHLFIRILLNNKRGKLLIHSWINLKNIMLNKRSQIQNTNSVWFHSCEILGSSITVIDRKQTSCCLGRGWKEGKENFLAQQKKNCNFWWELQEGINLLKPIEL